MKQLFHVQGGSALLIVLLVVGVITVCCSGVWKSASRVSDLILKKQVFLQKHAVAEGVLNYGIAFCKKHYKTIMGAGKKSFMFDLGRWDVGPCSYVGTVSCEVEEAAIRIKSEVKCEDEKPFVLHCCVVSDAAEKSMPHRLLITQWGIGET